MSGFRPVRLLHGDAPSHTCTSEPVKQFFGMERVTPLPHSPYSTNIVHVTFFFFHLSGRRSKSRQFFCSAIISYLPDQPRLNHLCDAFQNDFRGWNYVNQTVENTLKGCNVHFNIWIKCFWDTVQCPLRIEQPSCICIEERKDHSPLLE